MSLPGVPAILPAHLAVPDLLDALPDGAYVTDLDRRILFWNAAAERIMGWTAADVVGRSCQDNILVHVDKDGHPLCGREHCPLHRSIVTGQPSAGPSLVFAQSKAGDRVPVEVSVSPVRNAAGEIVGGIELFRDMTAGVRDLWRARRIQESALECPVSGDHRLEIRRCYQPQGVVGGDFCRVERCPGDSWTALVADVMGHGLASALYTMQLRSLWEDHRAELQAPGQFLGVLNERLHTLFGDAGYFASAVCVRYDAATGDLESARAGHPPPLLVRGDGRVDALPGKAQPALGMFPDSTYAESPAHLEPGDSLLLFTDGAVEVADGSETELGIEGLARLVSRLCAAQPGEGVPLPALEETLLTYCGQVHLPDDLTLLSLRRLPGAIRAPAV